MESAYWPPAHCEALSEFLTKGMSYRDAADAINDRFGTSYSRSAALGRGRRMGLGEPERSKPPPMADATFQRPPRPRSDDSALLQLLQRRPVFQRRKAVRLRCVDVNPRHLTLVELERGDCRYPYGGELEGDAITFCGHRRRKGSSYCTPHFHLTRNPDVPTERAASIAPLRLVAAAGTYRVEKCWNGTQEAQETL
ncbi:GcrA family cell cycle regulator [Bradyrhizobium sp.]|uniref:GcrA family cell cycle regulator n=1 Tax=Bradyrhizobium sp. TaxID=376 RepID=UPI00403828D4